MDLEDIHEMCEALDTQLDNTLIVLFKRGDYDEARSILKAETLENTRIKNNSVFDA